MAEYYIHKMVVVQFEQTPLILAFFEDQKAKVFDANTYQKLQDIKFSSNYGASKLNCSCDFKDSKVDEKCLERAGYNPDGKSTMRTTSQGRLQTKAPGTTRN